LSHIVQIETEVRDPVAVRAACERLQLPAPVDGTHQLFSEQVAGLGVQLPDWQYPVVCDIATGRVLYDNFGGRWGEQSVALGKPATSATTRQGPRACVERAPPTSSPLC
jgi:hypothetical protein